MYRVLMGLLAMLVAGTAAVPHRAEALQGTITGRVLDAQTQQPISTAQVFITDTGLGALSPVGWHISNSTGSGGYTYPVGAADWVWIGFPAGVGSLGPVARG